MLWVYENWITNQNGVRGHDGEASEEETAKAHVFLIIGEIGNHKT